MRIENDLHLTAMAFDQSAEALMITDATGHIVRVNHAFTEMTGYSATEIIGKTPSILRSGKHDARYYQKMWHALAEDGVWQGEIWNRRNNGEIYPQWQVITACRDETGEVSHYLSAGMDVSEKLHKTEAMRYLSEHDTLTGLPNRALLFDYFTSVVLPNHLFYAVIYILFDRLKTVNDTLGHHAGDLVICQVAQRLQEAAGEDGVVARFSGNGFVVLTPVVGPYQGAAEACDHLIERLQLPYHVQGRPVYLHSHLGIALYPEDSARFDDLVQFADTAAQFALTRPNQYLFFRAEMSTQAAYRMELEGALRLAVENQQLELHYQPKVDLKTGRIACVEALLRWEWPVGQSLAPDQFVPLLEETGLIVEVGNWALEQACRDYLAWQNAGLAAVPIAVNVAAAQLRNEDIANHVRHTLNNYGLSPDAIELEITESGVMEDPERVLVTLNYLSQFGIALTIDDFGTGYSSLSYLQRFPIDHLKIDKAFIHGIPADPNNTALVEAILAMCRALNLSVVAEGVEQEEQARFLLSRGCELGQGYLYGRAMRQEEIARLLPPARKIP